MSNHLKIGATAVRRSSIAWLGDGVAALMAWKKTSIGARRE